MERIKRVTRVPNKNMGLRRTLFLSPTAKRATSSRFSFNLVKTFIVDIANEIRKIISAFSQKESSSKELFH